MKELVPSKYSVLTCWYEPRPIRSIDDRNNIQRRIDTLVDIAASEGLTTDQHDFLDVLSILAGEYDNSHTETLPDIYGVELLETLMMERNLYPTDIPETIISRKVLNSIIAREKDLDIVDIVSLAKFFKVSPAVFVPR